MARLRRISPPVTSSNRNTPAIAGMVPYFIEWFSAGKSSGKPYARQVSSIQRPVPMKYVSQMACTSEAKQIAANAVNMCQRNPARAAASAVVTSLTDKPST